VDFHVRTCVVDELSVSRFVLFDDEICGHYEPGARGVNTLHGCLERSSALGTIGCYSLACNRRARVRNL